MNKSQNNLRFLWSPALFCCGFSLFTSSSLREGRRSPLTTESYSFLATFMGKAVLWCSHVLMKCLKSRGKKKRKLIFPQTCSLSLLRSLSLSICSLCSSYSMLLAFSVRIHPLSQETALSWKNAKGCIDVGVVLQVPMRGWYNPGRSRWVKNPWLGSFIRM